MSVPEFASLSAMLTPAGLASIKTFHALASDDTGYDGVIMAQLQGVISYVQFYCGHDFLVKQRIEKPYILPNERHFYVDFYPITSVTSVVESYNQGQNVVAYQENIDYYVDYDAGRIEKIDIPMNVLNPDRFTSAYWSIVRGSVIITYTGGIALDDNMISIVKELVGIRAGIKKRTWMDNEGVERVSVINSLSPMYQEMLDQYRRRKTRHIQSF